MKALVFGGPGQRSWDTVDDPGIQEPTDVIVKVDTTTICGTDLHILKGDVPAVPRAASSAMRRSARWSRPGRGERPEKGRPRARARDHLVRALRAMQGRDGRALRGGRRDRLDLRPPDRRRAGRVRAGPYAETSVHVVPEGVSESRCCSSPTSSDGYEIGVQNGARQARRHDRGRRRRTGRPGGDDDRADRRRRPDHRGRTRQVTAQARQASFGATHTGRRRERRAEIMEITAPGGVDVAMEAVGVPGTFDLCTRVVRAGGTVANIGVHGAPTTLHLEELWIKNVTITTGLVERRRPCRRCSRSPATGVSRPRSSAPITSSSARCWRRTTCSPQPVSTMR